MEKSRQTVNPIRRKRESPIHRWYPVTQKYIEYVAGRVDGAGGNSATVPPSLQGVPVKLPTGTVQEHCVTGKVCEVLYNCFGDFDGFVLCSCCAERHVFKACEKGIEEIALHACRHRLLISVCYDEKSKARTICRIIVKC